MDDHPTIDITKTPSWDCPNPVWNCIEYCFKANDFVLQVAGSALFTIEFTPDNYVDGIVISVGGKPFITETPGALGSFSWQGTQQQITENFINMLNSDFYFGSEFTVYQDTTFVIGFALKKELVPNWSMLFPVAIPPFVFSSPGSDLITRTNYRLVVELWKCEDQLRTALITTRSYEPNPDTSQVCLDISKALRSCVSTTFPGLTASTNIVQDETIKADICLRYGELYSDGSAQCEASTQIFETTTPITIINSAFQRDDSEGIKPFCLAETPLDEIRFLTNRPNFSQVCTESFVWLWYCLDSDFALLINDTVGLSLEAEVQFSYVNNSSSSETINVVPAFEGGVLIIPSGLAQIGGLATPGLPIRSYSIRLGTRLEGFPNLIYASEEMNFEIADGGFCCCHEEFYFLGEPGGFDTILFNCLREVDLDYSASEFCSFEPCEGDISKGGKEEAETRAFEIFRTTSRFLDTYQNINWIREFLKSSKRYWRKEGKVYKIMLLNDQTELRKKDEFLYLQLEFVLSFELNSQKN